MSRTARNLLRVLERERAFLRAGDIAGAAGLLERKAELAGTLEREGADPDTAARLREAARRNLPLLEAAREGARAAEGAVRAIANGVTTRTYAPDGYGTDIGSGRRRIERRA